MESKVIRTTYNYTKNKGMIICNNGTQCSQVKQLLSSHGYDLCESPGKGGSVMIKYIKLSSGK